MFSGGFGGFPFGNMSSEDDSAQEPKKQVDTEQYYKLLEVDKSATTQQIRKAFRKKALKEHPDKGGDPEKFKTITHAYQVLSNPQKRQLYDQYGQQGVQNGGPPRSGGFGDIFDFFGGGGRGRDSGPKKGKVKLIPLEVTLQQVYNGCMKKLKIKRTRNCQQCDGKGGKNVEKCPKCKGRKVVEKLVQLGPGMYSQSSAKCPDCKGTGQKMKQQDRCKVCKGDKIKEVQKQLQVAIEAGCPDQHDYIFTGESDQYPGIIPGDIYVRIKIKNHKVFTRKGADLVIIKNIELLEALTGVTININHVDGKKYTIATSPGEILSNLQFKVAKKLGMPFYKDPMSYGNLIIEFKVKFPKKNFFGKDKLNKLTSVLGMDIERKDFKNDKKAKILQEYSEADLNPNPQGGHHQEEEEDPRFQQGGGQRVNCQQQ